MPETGFAATEETKASWKDIRRGADVPPSDDKDEAASGAAIENWPKAGLPIDENTPPSTANTKTGSPSPQAKGGVLQGFTKKQQAALLKALENPEVVKALDGVEAAFSKSEEQKDGFPPHEEECDDEAPPAMPPAPMGGDKMYRSIQSLQKQVSDLTKAVSGLLAQKSDMQKSGYVEVSPATGKPGLAKLEQQPAYDQRQAALQKQVETFEDGGVPDFASLSTLRLKGVLP